MSRGGLSCTNLLIGSNHCKRYGKKPRVTSHLKVGKTKMENQEPTAKELRLELIREIRAKLAGKKFEAEKIAFLAAELEADAGWKKLTEGQG